jgi:hypothetical protein
MIRQKIFTDVQFLESVENKEIVNNEDPIIETFFSNQKVSSEIIKLDDPEYKEKVKQGITIGYPKKRIINTISFEPIQPAISSNQMVKMNPYRPVSVKGNKAVNTNGNYDIFSDNGDILGIGQLWEDLNESTAQIADNFNNLADELTSGWDYDSITSQSWGDLKNALPSINNFVKKPNTIASYLSTIQANKNHPKSLLAKMGQINMNLDYKIEFSPVMLQDYNTIASKFYFWGALKRTKGNTNLTSLEYLSPQIKKLEFNLPGPDYVAPTLKFDKKNFSKFASTSAPFEKEDKDPIKNVYEYFIKPIDSAYLYNAAPYRINYFSDRYTAFNSNRALEIGPFSLPNFIKPTTSFTTESMMYPLAEINESSLYLSAATISFTLQGNATVAYFPRIQNDYKGEKLIPPIKDDPNMIADGKETKSSEIIIQEKITNLRSRSIEYLLQSGPDFLQHMYDIMLVCSSADSDVNSFESLFSRLNNNEDISDKIKIKGAIDSSCFLVRAGAIDVPQIENDSFEMKFLFSSIKKTRSKTKYDKRAELKILLDEPLIFYTFFNLLTNNNSAIFSKLEAENRYPMRFAAFSTNRLIQENIVGKKIRIDLIIKHQKLLNYPEFEILKNSWVGSSNQDVKNFGGLTSPELPIWWFEDVNFLGQGGDLTFDRDSPSIVEMNYPFLFKRCVKINRLYKGGFGKEGRTGINVSSGPNAFDFHLFEEDTLNNNVGEVKQPDTDLFANQSDQEWYLNYLKTLKG